MKPFYGAASVAVLCLSVAVSACNGSSTSAPTVPGSTPTPVPTAAPTPLPPTAPPLPAATPYTASQSAVLTVPTAAPGATAPPIALALPTGGGVSGSIAIPVSGSTIPANTAVVETASNQVPAGLPALFKDRKPLVARHTLAGNAVATIQVDSLVFSNQVILASTPAFTYTVPPEYASVAGVSYWLAHYDPLYPLSGWDHAFEGPATVSGSTITFAPKAISLIFQANSPQYFALYAISAAAATPTPAPSTAPAPTPAPLGASPSSVELLGAGATATVTLTDASTTYSGAYSATSGDPTVATAAVSGKTVTITAVGPGQTTITITTTDSRQFVITVGVTTTTVPVQ